MRKTARPSPSTNAEESLTAGEESLTDDEESLSPRILMSE